MDLVGKRALVTGAASGIGLEIARGFRRLGATVLITDIEPEILVSARDDGLEGVVSDAADEDQVRALMRDIDRRLGGLDVLVNNVGIAGPTSPIESCDSESWRSTFDVNVHSQFYCVKHALPLLRNAPGASIINMSSAAGRLGMAGRGAYSASKWAVIGLTKTLAIELGAEGIRVNAICPGAVEGTRIDAVIEAKAEMVGQAVDEVATLYRSQSSLRRFVSVSDIANLAGFLASEVSSMIHGQAIAVDGHTEKLF